MSITKSDGIDVDDGIQVTWERAVYSCVGTTLTISAPDEDGDIRIDSDATATLDGKTAHRVVWIARDGVHEVIAALQYLVGGPLTKLAIETQHPELADTTVVKGEP